ncbi:hypothetical protein HYV22_02170 [Candidatus Gottesmanbacteria bacterium]|nr:hypothetical protein [Candidatus Gottesmanbacteria bacterium]
MPKKTKREKIIAEHRHQQIAIQGAPQFQFRVSPTQRDTTTPEFTMIQKDLVTTIALAAIAVTSEILLAKIIR